jgi:nucleoside-diphosphate-sugar epimerase
MKIFITGTTGFVGANLVEFYKDHEIYVYRRGTDIRANLDYFKPDVIINCAAEIYDPEIMWEPNVVIVRDCLEYVKQNTRTKMVQIGSSAEYGPMPRPSAEIDRINPVDMYQATKGASTLMCQGYARVYGLDISIARPYSVFGPHERPHRLFPRLWRTFKYGTPMKLYHGVHDFIYIDDFVRGIDMLVQRNDKPLGDIVNFGSGRQYTNLQVLEMFKQITGDNPHVEIVENMAKVYESEVWICDTTYAREQYGFRVEYDLESGTRRFLETAYYEQENT